MSQTSDEIKASPTEQVTEKDSNSSSDVELPKHGTSLVNILVIATACLGGFNYGFSANAISGTIAQTSFIAKFLSTSDAISREDGMIGGFFGGAMLGSVLQAPLANKFGRRPANALAAVIMIIAAALQAGSVNVGMFLFARTLCGIGAGMVLAITPVYMAEVSPPHTRGMLVGLQGVGIVTAYIGCSIFALAFSFVTADYQWRLTFVVLTAVSLIHLVSLWFLPESPRWLMQKGKETEARQVLEYLHRTELDPTGSLAHAEAVQIKAQVEAEAKLPKGFLYIFSTPHLRKRAFCAIILWVMGQGTGITAIATLIPTLMGTLGFGTTLQLGLGVVWCVCAVIGCGINVYLLGRVGRVKLLVAGGLGSAAILSIMAALEKYYLGTTSKPGINAAVALYFIFGAYFTSTIECTSYVYGSEIWPTHLRSEGSTLAYASFFGNAIAYSAPVAVALDNIGWRFYLVFVVVTVLTTLVIALYFPETMELTLEEVNVKFGEKVEIDLKAALTHEIVEEGNDESLKTV